MLATKNKMGLAIELYSGEWRVYSQGSRQIKKCGVDAVGCRFMAGQNP